MQEVNKLKTLAFFIFIFNGIYFNPVIPWVSNFFNQVIPWASTSLQNVKIIDIAMLISPIIIFTIYYSGRLAYRAIKKNSVVNYEFFDL